MLLPTHASFILYIHLVCPCAGKIPPGYVPEGVNHSEPFQPIATNGQQFPWLHPYLPSNIRPIRYTLTIHPNLTTLDVKGKCTCGQVSNHETVTIQLNSTFLLSAKIAHSNTSTTTEIRLSVCLSASSTFSG